jgi:predicted MFS family arabinose efflux permease
MGRVYKFYPIKTTFLTSIALFEIGSVISGASPNAIAFILGRAISGIGSAGIFSGAMMIMFLTVPLEERPLHQGGFGAVFALGSVIGPLLGGVFTDKLTWRWCFYINLPFGACTVFTILFILHVPANTTNIHEKYSIKQRVEQLDPLGICVFLPAIVCLVLALTWGGSTYAWSNSRIIALLVIFGVLTIVFVGIQIWRGDKGTLPPRLVTMRSVWAAMWFGFFNGGNMILLYYLPIWFQAIKGVSAIKSGIMLLPMILSAVVGSVASGALISRIGYYTPFAILSSVISSIGAGMFTTFTPSTGRSAWIGWQVMYGIGLGMGSQQPMLVVQTVLDRADVSTGTAIIMFVRFLGSVIFLAVAQSVFLGKLVKDLTSNLPDIDTQAIVNGGATELRNLAPSPQDLVILLEDYNDAIINVFYLALAMTCLTIIGALSLEWKNLKERAAEQNAGTA